MTKARYNHFLSVCKISQRYMSTVAEVMTSKQLKRGVFNKRWALKLCKVAKPFLPVLG